MREIALECKPDEVLVKALGIVRKRIVHQPSRGEVLNYLKKNPATTGIVDDDPGAAKPTYFSKFQSEGPEKFEVEGFCIPRLNSRLIVIKPRLEEWVLKHAESSQIDPKDFSLPENGHNLHKIINARLPRFENMLAAMLAKKSPALLHLQELIEGK